MIRKLFFSNVFKAVFLLLGALWLFSNADSVFGCEIELKVIGEKKDVYAINDVINLKISVEYTHKVCVLGIDETKFSVTGLEIAEASEWKEIQAKRKYEKDLKLKVISDKEGKLVLSVVRGCELGGGTGSITLKSVPTR